MIRNLLVASMLLIGTAFSLQARADYWFRVSDASQIQYLIDSGQRVYLRNLNTFDTTVLGCCYNYWIDLSTEGGKAQFATLLAKIETREHIWIYLLSQTVPGAVATIMDLG